MDKWKYFITRYTDDGKCQDYSVKNSDVSKTLADIIEKGSYKKRQWGEWKKVDGVKYPTSITPAPSLEYRTDGKRVEVRAKDRGKTVKGRATCCDGDKFDLYIGVAIAYLRMGIKVFGREIENIIDDYYIAAEHEKY